MRIENVLHRTIATIVCCLLLLIAFPAATAQVFSPALIALPWRAYNESGYVYVSLGRTAQGAQGEYAPIVWRVLEESDGVAYLMSEYVLGSHRIHPDYEEHVRLGSDWKQTEIFGFLNGAWLSESFTKKERACLIKDEELGTIYLPTVEDIRSKTYGLQSNGARMGFGTPWALQNGLFQYGSNNLSSPYWTRIASTSGYGANRCTKVDGSVGYIRVVVRNLGYRPVCRIKTSKVEQIGGFGTLAEPYQLVPKGGERATLPPNALSAPTLMDASRSEGVSVQADRVWSADALGFIRFEKDGKIGLTNAAGVLVVEAKYDWIDPAPVNNTLRFTRDGKWGCFNLESGVIVDAWWDELLPFEEELTLVKRVSPDGTILWRMIDRAGDVEIKPSFASARPFSQGFASVMTGKGLFGYIENDGALRHKAQWDAAQPYSAGFAAVRKGDMWGYLNKRGKIIVKAVWLEARAYGEGLAAVRDENGWQFINEKGKTTLQGAWEDAGTFVALGDRSLAPVCVGGLWGYIDTSGAYAIPPRYAEAGCFSAEGLAPVCTDGQWGYIDANGEIVIPCHYDSAEAFQNGVARVTLHEVEGAINVHGEVLCGFTE